MSRTISFQEKSYERHSEHFRIYSSGGEKEAHAKTWLMKDTVDAWRHHRMYQVLDPILNSDPKANWLTIGDGRFGKDAKYILENNGNAIASDISDILLKDAKNIGYISAYRKENAESLSFQDNEFDYVFCKESYHHFPRPMLAVYEMLRVARKGIFLIEPNDPYIYNRILEAVYRNFIKSIKRILGRKTNKHAFESSGNYVFCISRREIEKVALGLNYKTIALKGINDIHFAGVEYEKLAEKGPLQKNIKLHIHIANFLSKIGITDYKILAAIIFKKEPSNQLLQKLKKQKYEIIHLPDNPYIPR